MKARLTLALFAGLLSSTAVAQQVLTWSSSDCSECQSTIVSAKWYLDGSGLAGEAIDGKTATAVAAVSLIEGNFAVAIGLGMESGPPISINPKHATTLETDSAPHMVLYPLSGPESDSAKKGTAVKRLFKGETVTLTPQKPLAGFLFFPSDPAATHVTVVITVGSETFRFPFARDPSARAKFGDPAKFAQQAIAREAREATASSTEGLAAPPRAQAAADNTPSGQKLIAETMVAAKGSVPTGQDAKCAKSIAFAVAEGGPVVSREPKFTRKWIEKNERKYPGICFSQTPGSQSSNYVVVFSTSQSAFNGIYPTTRTSTATNTTPVNGSGTITSNYGTTWNYTYSGSVTTTTTTTSQVNLPYTDTTRAIYAYAYDDRGDLVSRRYRTITTRQGGDGANTLGYNLGAALGSIHLRERLLKDAVEDIARTSQ
jgi:hypothetical protein